MTTDNPELQTTQHRSSTWTRLVCLILLSATFLNYSNRFTFTQNAIPIQNEFLFAGVGISPLLAFAVLALFWGKRPTVHGETTLS